MENIIKMDDLGVPLFLETSICWVISPYLRDFSTNLHGLIGVINPTYN